MSPEQEKQEQQEIPDSSMLKGSSAMLALVSVTWLSFYLAIGGNKCVSYKAGSDESNENNCDCNLSHLMTNFIILPAAATLWYSAKCLKKHCTRASSATPVREGLLEKGDNSEASNPITLV